MNSLSSMIYAIGVLDKLDSALDVLSFCSLLFALASIGFYGYCLSETCKPYDEDELNLFSKIKGFIRNSVYIFFIACFFNIIIPSKNTAIMIASSEVAGMIVQSENGKAIINDVSGLSGSAVDLLKAYMESQKDELLKSMKPEEKKQ